MSFESSSYAVIWHSSIYQSSKTRKAKAVKSFRLRRLYQALCPALCGSIVFKMAEEWGEEITVLVQTSPFHYTWWECLLFCLDEAEEVTVFPNFLIRSFASLPMYIMYNT